MLVGYSWKKACAEDRRHPRALATGCISCFPGGALGCTAGKMEKESEGSTFAYKVDDAKCKGGEYDIKLDQNFNVIIMLRD
jgi:hypothetical protein